MNTHCGARGALMWAALPLVAALGPIGCQILSGLSELNLEADGATGGGGSGQTASAGGDGGAAGTGTDMVESCFDSTQNGSETDRDCGGEDCAPCNLGQHCLGGADCVSGICGFATANVCAKATSVSAGNAHVCATLDTGELYCWGDNSSGQLGGFEGTESLVPFKVPLSGVVLVSCGGLPGGLAGHTCALTTSGQVACWGDNDNGQLGTGDLTSQSAPSIVAGLPQMVDVAAGGAFTCALSTQGELSCWGRNESGELSDPDIGALSSVPAQVSGLSSVKSLSTGAKHACATLSYGEVWCWGDNESGQVGAQGFDPATKPTLVSSLLTPSWAFAGKDLSCALANTELFCWGDNSDGQLTSAFLGELSIAPVSTELTSISMAALGADGDADLENIGGSQGGHVCALHDGKVACWGNNRKGQLGRGAASASESAPADVPDLAGATFVAAGAQTSCAVLNTGSIQCWGRNDRGQLGIGTKSAQESTPVTVKWP